MAHSDRSHHSAGPWCRGRRGRWKERWITGQEGRTLRAGHEAGEAAARVEGLLAGVRQDAKVHLLSLVSSAVGLAFLLELVRTLVPLTAPVRLPWWGVAALTVAADLSVIRFVRFRQDARGFSLGEMALVAGLFLAHPIGLVIGRVLGLAAVDAVQQRGHSLVKLTFNIAKLPLESCVALLVFHLVVTRADPLGPAGWVAALLAAVASELVSKLLIDLAIGLSGAPRAGSVFGVDLWFGLAVALGTTSVALIGVTLVWLRPGAGWLLLVPTLLLVAAYRAYARDRPRQDAVAFLYDLSVQLQRAGGTGAILDTLLEHARDAFQAESAQVVLLPRLTGRSPTRTMLGPDGQHHTLEIDLHAAGAWLQAAGAGARLIAGAEAEALAGLLGIASVRTAMLAPLDGSGGVCGVLLLVNRQGSGSFGVAELKALQTMANHAGIALDNARLLGDLHHQATFDLLTGLPNRSLLTERMTAALARAAELGTTVGLIFIDLDGFKRVNDALGHQAGDQLLSLVARRLADSLRAADLLARLSGDEFVVLCQDVEDEDVLTGIAERVVRNIGRPFTLDAGMVNIGASVGIATSRGDETDPGSLLRAADGAMYQAKRQGRGRYHLSRADR